MIELGHIHHNRIAENMTHNVIVGVEIMIHITLKIVLLNVLK